MLLVDIDDRRLAMDAILHAIGQNGVTIENEMEYWSMDHVPKHHYTIIISLWDIDITINGESVSFGINGIHSPWIIYPGQVLVVKSTTSESASASTGTRYTVRRGDTLSGIGSRTGVAWRTIASINGIHSPWIIYPGQRLRLR